MLNQNAFTARCTIGLMQGLFLYILIEITKNNFFDNLPYIVMPFYLVGIYVPFLLVQGWGNMRIRTLAVWCGSTAVLLALLTYYAVYRQMLPEMSPKQLSSLVPCFDFFLTTTIALYIAHSLVLSGDQDNKLIAHYPTYFDVAWKIEIQLMLTAIFVGLFWSILLLGAGLFKVIHLTFFSTLISKSWFAIPATTVAAAVALHVTDINVRMIAGMRTLILTLLSWLLPIITIITTLFLVSLLLTGTSLLWQTKFAGSMLVWTALIFVLLINSSYQEGSRIVALPRWQRMISQLACCVLTPIMLLAIWALSLRVQQYGWTPMRIYAAVCMFILIVYSVGYTFSAMLTNASLKLIERVNVCVAFLMVAIYLFLASPLGDPARLFVNNQLSRLHAGVVTPQRFDYISLRMNGMRYGQAALVALQQEQAGADTNIMHQRAQEALTINLENVWNYRNKYRDKSVIQKAITAYTPDGKLPDSFIDQDWDAQIALYEIPNCLTGGTYEQCQAWIRNDADNKPLVIILNWRAFFAFKQDENSIWKLTGIWEVPAACYNKMNQAAKDGNFKLVPPQPDVQDMEINGQRLSFKRINNEKSCR